MVVGRYFLKLRRRSQGGHFASEGYCKGGTGDDCRPQLPEVRASPFFA
jgi:hypothetical protein